MSIYSGRQTICYHSWWWRPASMQFWRGKKNLRSLLKFIRNKQGRIAVTPQEFWTTRIKDSLSRPSLNLEDDITLDEIERHFGSSLYPPLSLFSFLFPFVACVCKKKETYVLLKRFEPESFQLKYNPPTFEYKIYFVEVDLFYFKYL